MHYSSEGLSLSRKTEVSFFGHYTLSHIAGPRTPTILLLREDDGTGKSRVKCVVKATCDIACQRRSMQVCRHICSLLVLLYVFEHDGSKTALPNTWLPGARRQAEISAGKSVAPDIVYLSDCRVIPGVTLSYKDFVDPTATAGSLAAKVQNALDNEKKRVHRRETMHRRRAARLTLTPASIAATVAGLRITYSSDTAMLAFMDSIPF